MEDARGATTGGAASALRSGRGLVATVARRVWHEAFTDHTMMVAAGLAFFAVFAILPAVAAVAAVYGHFVDTDTLDQELAGLTEILPEDTIALLSEFLTEVPRGLGFGLGLAANLVVVLWTVQRSASGVITALNVVYDETEKRSRVRREAVALAIAGGVLVFLFLSLFLVAVLPLFAAALGDTLGPIVRLARWPLLALLFMLGLGLLYTFAPGRERVRWQWISWGAAVATVLWLAVSVLFSLYITHAADFGRFYGSLTAGVVLLTWLFISAFVVMVGAEINAQLAAVMAGDRGDGLKKTLDERERAAR